MFFNEAEFSKVQKYKLQSCFNYFSMKVYVLSIVNLHLNLHFTSCLSTLLSKILPHLKPKKAKNWSVFSENDSCRLFSFLETHIF